MNMWIMRDLPAPLTTPELRAAIAARFIRVSIQIIESRIKRTMHNSVLQACQAEPRSHFKDRRAPKPVTCKGLQKQERSANTEWMSGWVGGWVKGTRGSRGGCIFQAYIL